MKDRKTVIRIGMACLAIAMIWPRFVHATFNLGPDVIDATRGLLLGLAIGFNLWAVRLASRHRCGNGT